MDTPLNFNIRNKWIGEGAPVFIIAEVAQAHDGSLGAAHAYIDAVARAGADAVKFQTHIAKAESSPEEKFRVNIFPQDLTRYDYWKRMEFTFDQWRGLAEHAREKGLIFLSSPFSIEAVEMLEMLEMDAWKIGSGELSNFPLVDRVIHTNKPILLSTGMSNWGEIGQVVDKIKLNNNGFALFQCTSIYPCPPEKVGLNLIAELRDKFNVPVGLSDHSGTIFPSLAAVTLGSKLIEVHTVFSKECFGPDTSSSLTIEGLAELVSGIRFLERALIVQADKDKIAPEIQDMRMLFGRGIYAKTSLSKGHILELKDLVFKKPCGEFSIQELDQVIGKKIKNSCQINQPILRSNLE